MTNITTPFTIDELAELDRLRRAERMSRTETIRTAIRWYARWAEQLPDEDPADDQP